MSPRPDLAAESRDNHLTLRRVERQHAILNRLVHATAPVTAPRLASELGVSARTIVRDVRRLRESGVPLIVKAGRRGGTFLTPCRDIPAIQFDLAELAALIASLAALGPTATEPAASAIRKLTHALAPPGDRQLRHVDSPQRAG